MICLFQECFIEATLASIQGNFILLKLNFLALPFNIRRGQFSLSVILPLLKKKREKNVPANKP